MLEAPSKFSTIWGITPSVLAVSCCWASGVVLRLMLVIVGGIMNAVGAEFSISRAVSVCGVIEVCVGGSGFLPSTRFRY